MQNALCWKSIESCDCWLVPLKLHVDVNTYKLIHIFNLYFIRFVIELRWCLFTSGLLNLSSKSKSSVTQVNSQSLIFSCRGIFIFWAATFVSTWPQCFLSSPSHKSHRSAVTQSVVVGVGVGSSGQVTPQHGFLLWQVRSSSNTLQDDNPTGASGGCALRWGEEVRHLSLMPWDVCVHVAVCRCPRCPSGTGHICDCFSLETHFNTIFMKCNRIWLVSYGFVRLSQWCPKCCIAFVLCFGHNVPCCWS